MRKAIWFGTEHHAEWIDAPLAGADMSPQSWGTEGTYLSGGGFARNAKDSHRQYIFEFSGASSIEKASKMQMFRDGVYSKRDHDLMYFHDPLVYRHNILPKRWAQPGIIAADHATTYGPYGRAAKAVTPASFVEVGVPFTGATIESFIELNDTVEEVQKGVLWVPIPEGKTLHIEAWVSEGSNDGLYVVDRKPGGGLGVPTRLGANEPLWLDDALGAYLYVAGTTIVYGARAVLTEGTSDLPDNWRTWVTGLGHSGCAFVGNPTWYANNAVNGGQVSYATTLKEVGDWL